MRFFNLPRKPLTDEELRDALFNAAARSSRLKLEALLASHVDRVIQLFPTWTTLPASVGADPARTKWWAEGMIGVAAAAAQLGEGSLMASLLGRPEENTIMVWQEAFLAAEADAARGDYNAAIRKLEGALEKAKDLIAGSGVDHLLPKTYGLLGAVNYKAGNRDQAREFTLKAKVYCERIGDREGAEIYARNLSIIDVV